MVRPWVMSYSLVYFGVWISSTLGTELPYCPVGTMFVVKEFDQGIGGIAIGSLRVGR